MTTLQTINASASPEVQANENFETLSAAGIFGKRQPVTTGLVWGYYGGRYNGNTVTDGTVTLTGSSTNYVVVHRTTGVVSASTSSTNYNDTTTYARLYQLTTSASAVTATVDGRMDTGGVLNGGGGTGGTELKGLTFTSDTSSTADSDPGAGKFKWNNATQASATVLYLDDQTADAVSLSTFWASLGSAGFMYLQQQDDSTKWQLWKWTATPVDGTGYRKFTVALQANGGSIVNNKLVDMDFSGASASGGVTSVDATGGVETASGSAITSTGTVRGAVAVNAQTGTSYTYVSGDRGKLVTHSNAAAIAGTLPQATGSFGAGWYMWVQNRGVGSLTITPTTSTIDGAASLVLATDSGVVLMSDGTNYFTFRGVKPASSGSTQGRHAVYVAAGSMVPSVSNGSAALSGVASGSDQPDIWSLDFDPTTQEFAQFALTMPKSWDEGTVTFAAVWSHAATATNFGVVWQLQGYAASNDDAIATNYGTAQFSTDTGGTTNDLYVGPESSAITIAGTPAAEDTVFFRVARVPAHGSDTMAIDARLMGLVLYITTNADTDA
jgi:hypothetical protein